MDNGAACARRARAVAPLADDGRFRSLLAAASGDHAYQALVKAVADRTKGADLGAYAKELDNMELVGEVGSDEQLVALNGRLVVPESWVSEAISTVHTPPWVRAHTAKRKEGLLVATDERSYKELCGRMPGVRSPPAACPRVALDEAE